MNTIIKFAEDLLRITKLLGACSKSIQGFELYRQEYYYVF